MMMSNIVATLRQQCLQLQSNTWQMEINETLAFQ